MKRFGNLYSQICDIKNIEMAHFNARKGKQYYMQVREVDKNPVPHFLSIKEMLEGKTFRNSAYKVSRRIEGGKERDISKLPYFPDRIIHHCILQVIGPIWLQGLIHDTYACVKGRGIHAGVRRIKEALRDRVNTTYCFKADVRKFYPSVDHDILKENIRRKIKDRDLLWLLDEIIDSTDGIPIGNYLSQHFGNLYLSGLDHFIKETLGCKYYFRYCDDLVILHANKNFLHEARKRIDEYLNVELKLFLKTNWQISPVDSRGIDFLGYRFFHDYTLLRKSIAKRIKAKMTSIKNWQHLPPVSVVSGIMSYHGWMKHGNCFNLSKSVMNDNVIDIVGSVCRKAGIRNPLLKIHGIPA